MDLPLETLKLVSDAMQASQGPMPYLVYSQETGYLLYVMVNGQPIAFNFDVGETIEDLKEQITAATGITFIDAGMKKKSSLGRLDEIRSRAAYEVGSRKPLDW